MFVEVVINTGMKGIGTPKREPRVFKVVHNYLLHFYFHHIQSFPLFVMGFCHVSINRTVTAKCPLIKVICGMLNRCRFLKIFFHVKGKHHMHLVLYTFLFCIFKQATNLFGKFPQGFCLFCGHIIQFPICLQIYSTHTFIGQSTFSKVSRFQRRTNDFKGSM